MSIIINAASVLGASIRDERKEQSLTLQDLSIRASVGIRFISELERGKQTAELAKVLDVLNALGIELVLQKKASDAELGNVFRGMKFTIIPDDEVA